MLYFVCFVFVCFFSTHMFYLVFIFFVDPSMKFPKTYPTSCLLGCVHVDDCLPQDEYRQKYPNGESASPFVLICRNPAILPLFYPISGQHKICKFLILLNFCLFPEIVNADNKIFKFVYNSDF